MLSRERENLHNLEMWWKKNTQKKMQEEKKKPSNKTFSRFLITAHFTATQTKTHRRNRTIAADKIAIGKIIGATKID